MPIIVTSYVNWNSIDFDDYSAVPYKVSWLEFDDKTDCFYIMLIILIYAYLAQIKVITECYQRAITGLFATTRPTITGIIESRLCSQYLQSTNARSSINQNRCVGEEWTREQVITL